MQSLLYIENLGRLFETVQMKHIFSDQKTFADSVPKYPVADIVAKFDQQNPVTNEELLSFVKENFHLPQDSATKFKSDHTVSLYTHINLLWDVLTKETPENNGTSIGLPEKFVVPGGRFRELFYWDSYFTMLGLYEAGKTELLQNMTDNFAFLIDRFGHIPNGTRTYFLSRSQPPFFSLMIDLLSKINGEAVYIKYLPHLIKEHDFWMQGEEQLSAADNMLNRVVLMPDGTVLNRYWDNLDTPRPEGYFEDIQIGNSTDTDEKTVFRNIRAACESGWDFSSRWFADQQNIHTIYTSDIVPVDLNCLLLHLEQTLEKAFSLSGDMTNAETYRQKADVRMKSVQDHLWSRQMQTYTDFICSKKQPSACLSLAMVFPLFMQVATAEQAANVIKLLEAKFLFPGGLVTTLNHTGQQWDMPNGWAPLQWIAYKGALHYGDTAFAHKLKSNWLNTVEKMFRQSGRLMEKYNVKDIDQPATGGEYPNQDGFGWTNGVYLAMLHNSTEPCDG